MFVLRRRSDKKYVTKPGSARSYSRNFDDADIFTTREMAKGNSCVESEYVQEIVPTLRGHR